MLQYIAALLVGLGIILILWTNGVLGTKKEPVLQTILIIGPTGAGKTQLFLGLTSADSTQTVTSQQSNQSTLLLPFDSEEKTTKIQIKDLPGHPKLFHLVEQELKSHLRNIAGIVFVVDSASIGKFRGDGVSNEAIVTSAQMLCKVLELTEKHPNGVDILVAGNKNDIFNAVGATKLRSLLEKEVLELMSTTGKLSSSNELDGNNDGEGSPLAWIGTSDKFSFDELEAQVDFLDGSAKNRQINPWKTWIEQQVFNH